MPVDCRVYVEHERFADTGDDLAAGTPTVLADLELTWGRASTVDQPDAATVRVSVLDPSGGDRFVDLVDVGSRLEVRAAGDIGTGTPRDVAVDGSFEDLTPGPVTAGRVAVTSGVAAVVAGGSDGAQSIDWSAMNAGAALDAPADGFTADPAGWDEIPRFATGAIWSWSIAVRAPRGATVTAGLFAYTAPDTVAGGRYVDTPLTVTADRTWRTVGGTVTVGAGAAGGWPGVHVVATMATWAGTAGTWAAAAGTWAEYGPPVSIDRLELVAPATGLRDVIAFAGRVTDLTARLDGDRGLRVELIATDQLAELQNRYVGAAPWPSETLAARFGRILADAGLTAAVDVHLDADLADEILSWRDVDRQAVGALLIEFGAGVDGVVWSAVHATTGPYIWLEDTAHRAAVNTLALVNGVLTVTVAGNRPPGTTVLDGCDLPADMVTWGRDVSDVLTVVDAAWLEQTVDTEGNQQPTEHTVTVADAAAVSVHGTRRLGVSTNLITAAAATAVADRILARTRQPEWRVDGLVYDLGATPPAVGAETGDALDLLDGTIRLGRPILVENVPEWPGDADAFGLYLDGGTYRFDGAWSLNLAASPWIGFGTSPPWNTLDPAWRWNQWDPALEWADLNGVTV